MTDLSGVVNEQQATIETLRRRVAELERERDTALVTAEVAQAELLKCREVRNTSHELQKLHFQESKRLHGRIESLTAENAELKRQAGKWKEYSDYHDMIADEFATENAELKRQVDAMREDAEKIEDSKIPVKHLPTIITLAEKMIAWKRAEQDVFRPGSCEQECHRRQYTHELAIEIQDLTAVLEGTKALREATKGGLEG